MDALRKAERARKEMTEVGELAVERPEDEVAAVDEIVELNLNALDIITEKAVGGGDTQTTPPTDPEVEKGLEELAGLSLTPLEAGALDQPLAIDPPPTPTPQAKPDGGAPETLSRTVPLASRVVRGPARTPERPAVAEIQKAAPVDNTQQQPHLTPNPDASRSKANAVFQSKRVVPPRSSHGLRVMVLSGVVLLLLVAGAGGYLYFMDDGSGLMPQGQVAYQALPADEPLPADAATEEVQPVVEPLLASVAETEREPMVMTSALRLTPESAVPAADESPLWITPQVMIAAEQVSAPAPLVPQAASMPVQTVVPVASASEALRVIRKVSPNKINGMVRSAWEAFMQGDLARAREGYQGALALDRMNRDGLLGLAAVEAAEGNPPAAAGYYRRLLERDPRDAAALEGMMALGGEAGVPDEHALRSLSRSDGKSGGAPFALGNLYAAQTRWVDAQAAYFDAYSRMPENPDYAFNLAVSLEHIGQHQPALNYYRQALELARQRPHGFDPAQAQSRIDALLAQGGGNHG